MKKDISKNAAYTGILAALAASSCCIPPLIAVIAGIGGGASTLSWMEPYRPYMIGLAIIAIGYSWHVHLKPKEVDDCGCSIGTPKWYQTRTFLVGMTLFAAVSISLPYYSHLFFQDTKKEVIVVDQSNLEKLNVYIEGMTCTACEGHVNHSVNKLEGIIDINTSYKNANSTINYDKSKTTIEEIEKAINSTGYSVIGIKEN